ncbi:hypothetical protein EYZ11_007010 [Aspergillus tanneri]|uniref:G-protein coupled receptors family 2 profile 2 domain-containing protein n=1 Tax=Aspergillus tanneri TaxID=1220188 RepID=A0A4S3JE15_9EURO|nr:hypothetical protein EYZ11_007010 [Aspergillus tanneri]
MSPSENQLFAISTTERVCSAISLAATAIVVVSFICSSAFRKPINRLVFYASWGNIMANLATVISQSGIRAGLDSPLCQFQAFLMQWFMPADALWTLAMACNVYLTFFRKYDSEQLRRLEWKYLLFCYGLPFVPAFTYFFIRTKARGRVYGSALIWCWVAPSWDFLRIAVFYGPVWFVIFLTFAIYARTGGVIYQKRRQLRRAGSLGSENLKPSFSKTTEVSITSEVSSPNECYRPTVTIEGGPSGAIALKTVKNDPPNPHLQRRIMAAEANSAAWAYTKYAMLFFVALIITWMFMLGSVDN